MGIRVGIDLGTTFSAVAKINEHGKPEVIRNSFGNTTTPSVLCFESNGNVLFGEDAKNSQAEGNLNTASFFKRNMGNDSFLLDFFGKSYSPTDLSAVFLKKLIQDAEKNCGEKIDGAVITVPAYFAHKEREATIEAGKRAGIDVIAIINEPTAAAFAYGLNEKDKEQTALIYDLGGGTFDVTVARIDRNKIDILGSDGNHKLGGKDWDECIARYLSQQFEEEYGENLSQDQELLTSLLVTAENVKKQLTSRDVVNVPIRCNGVQGNIEITEKIFEEITEYLLGETKNLTNDLLDSLGIPWKDVDGAILVGGSTRMRMIHDYVKEMSGKEPLGGVNVDEAVALGAAIRANIDEKGNASRAGFVGTLGGKTKTVMSIAGAKAISDATVHALGMIAENEDRSKYVNSVIIPKNASVPAESKKKYNIRSQEMEVYVLQGGFERPLDNNILYKYVITGIQPVPGGWSEVEVSYRYTSNATVEVSAVQNGKNLTIKIEDVPEDMSWSDGVPGDTETETTIRSDMEIVLAVDLSGSMEGEPLDTAKDAMRNFVTDMISDRVKIGMVAFGTTCEVLIKPTSDSRSINRIINNLEIGLVGYSTEAEPFTDARYSFERRLYSKDNTTHVRYIVVLTDGIWAEPDDAIMASVVCRKLGIEIIALGFGDADVRFLKKIASVDEFASLTDLTQLNVSFSRIAQVISEGGGPGGLKVQ